MGNRLSKIYTRTGDDGTTGLGDGSRTSKCSLRVHAMGDVDELNAVLGMLLVESVPESIRVELVKIQHDLFNLGAELCIPGYSKIASSRVEALEAVLDDWNATLAPLKEFILPGGHRTAAVCHLARAVCRRAERAMHALNQEMALSLVSLQYINRLSDLLFVLCRILNQQAGVQDVLWNHTDETA